MVTFSASVYPSSWISSIRSSSGPGMGSSTLAVAMNSTSDRSSSTSR